MIMTLNDLLTKQNVITKLILKDGNKELSKELKVKIMRVRMAYNKVKKQFDEDSREFTNQIVTDELKNLVNKPDKTEEEEKRFRELNDKANAEYQEYLIQKGLEEVTTPIDDTFTLDEYSEILDVNAGNDVEINGNKIKAADLMETFLDLFVKE
jgi:hypothetical protein